MKNKIIPKIIVNSITLIRLLGAILLPFIYFKANIKITAIIVLIIFFTDMLDGFLARIFKCYTFFGAVLDVFSDKLLNIIVFIIIGLIYPIMFISLALELLIFLVNICIYKEGFNVKARLIGKIKTIILSLSIIFIFIFLIFNENSLTIISTISMIVIIAQIIALLDYLISTFKYPTFREKVKYGSKLKNKKEMVKIFFDSNFYIENKDKPLKVLLYK